MSTSLVLLATQLIWVVVIMLRNPSIPGSFKSGMAISNQMSLVNRTDEVAHFNNSLPIYLLNTCVKLAKNLASACICNTINKVQPCQAGRNSADAWYVRIKCCDLVAPVGIRFCWSPSKIRFAFTVIKHTFAQLRMLGIL